MDEAGVTSPEPDDPARARPPDPAREQRGAEESPDPYARAAAIEQLTGPEDPTTEAFVPVFRAS
jgi:hypothetical protein